MAPGPQTTREALMAELIGDVGTLADRLDVLVKSIPAAADSAIHGIEEQTAALQQELQKALLTLQNELLNERRGMKRELNESMTVVTAAASTVTDGLRQTTTMALILGASAGALAGVLAAVVAWFLLQ